MRTPSVIVVSNGRPDALRRCLTAIGQLFYPAFEIVVVADRSGIAALKDFDGLDAIKLVSFDEPNISAARNLGIEHAAGEIVAFIDDDAVPEPTWLDELAGAFDDPAVSAAGGYVRGRNGVSWQWRAGTVDEGGQTHLLRLDHDTPTVLHPAHGRAIKTEGTNMAFRRDVLASLGGFDPAFRFYLDESDLNMRLAAKGHATAIVPRAEVHHGFAASARRRQDRVPLDLFEIGASQAAFLLRHCPDSERPTFRAGFVEEQRKRLLRHMVAGRLAPGDVRRLLDRLHQGFDEGLLRKPQSLTPLARAADGFSPFPNAAPNGIRLHSGRWSNRRKLRRKAAQDVADGHMTSVMIFSPTTLYGRVTFTKDGYWEHWGGQFGRMERDEPIFKPLTLKQKIRRETQRIARARGLPTQ